MVARLEAILYHLLRFNPAITINELRMRMRGSRPFIVLFIYSLVAAAAVLFTLLITYWAQGAYNWGSQTNPLGQTPFAVLVFTQLTLILVILPAYAASSVAAERERHTLEMLKASLLSPTDVVTGKLLVAFAFGVMLLLSSLPVAAWCLLLGGVSPHDLLYAYTFLAIVAAGITALGVWLSAISRRTVEAVVRVYFSILLLLAIVPAIYSAAAAALESFSGPFKIGVGGAVLVTLVGAALVTWALYHIFRSLGQRLPSAWPRWLRSYVPVGCGVGLSIWLGSHFIPDVFSAIASADLPSLLVVHPYVALAGIVIPDLAQELLPVRGGSHTISSQTAVWLVASLALLLLSYLLSRWSVSAYSRTGDK